MHVRIYDQPNVPPVVVQELLKLLNGATQDAQFAAIAFYNLINGAQLNGRLPGGGSWLQHANYCNTTMRPPGSIVMHKKYQHRLYYSYLRQAGGTEMRIVLVANGNTSETANVTTSIDRHNCM
jgi:hypothetical protein